MGLILPVSGNMKASDLGCGECSLSNGYYNDGMSRSTDEPEGQVA